MENDLESRKNKMDVMATDEKTKKNLENIHGFLSNVATLVGSVDHYLTKSKETGNISKRVEVLFDWNKGKMVISK